ARLCVRPRPRARASPLRRHLAAAAARSGPRGRAPVHVAMTDFEATRPVQEEDRARAGYVLVIAAVAAAVTCWSLVIALCVLRAAGGTPGAPPAPFAPREIATVEQTLILDVERGMDLRRRQEEALARAAWIDRDAGLAQIPIDVAMQAVVEREEARR